VSSEKSATIIQKLAKTFSTLSSILAGIFLQVICEIFCYFAVQLVSLGKHIFACIHINIFMLFSH
jgi:hypothetical protein